MANAKKIEDTCDQLAALLTPLPTIEEMQAEGWKTVKQCKEDYGLKNMNAATTAVCRLVDEGLVQATFARGPKGHRVRMIKGLENE